VTIDFHALRFFEMHSLKPIMPVTCWQPIDDGCVNSLKRLWLVWVTIDFHALLAANVHAIKATDGGKATGSLQLFK
jgi:hypothetical protein